MCAAQPAGAQQVTKPTVPGASNFAKLETTVACGGATTPEAVPEIKKMGFKSIINLRLPNEAGANIDAEAAAAKAAGINFYSIPFSGQAPDPRSPTSSSTRSPRPATSRRTSTAPPATAPVRCG